MRKCASARQSTNCCHAETVFPCVQRYASFLRALGKELHATGRQLDMCVSSWSILTNFTLYQSTGVDRMQSMASTYNGHGGNSSIDKYWVTTELAEGVDTSQLAVGTIIFCLRDSTDAPAKLVMRSGSTDISSLVTCDRDWHSHHNSGRRRSLRVDTTGVRGVH